MSQWLLKSHHLTCQSWCKQGATLNTFSQKALLYGALLSQRCNLLL